MLVEVSVQVGSSQLFEVHFQEFFLSYLKDPVFQIRMHGNSLLSVRFVNLAYTDHRAAYVGYSYPGS